MIGPFIPEHLLKNKREEQSEQEEEQKKEYPVADPNDEEDDIDAYAPELPPDMLEPAPAAEPAPKRRRAPIGPSLPSGPASRYEDDEEDDIIGPVLPGGIVQEDDEDISSTINEIEERARRAKEAADEQQNDKGKLQRGDWMLVPPEAQFLKGVDQHKSRQFSKSEVKNKVDNSVWTDTPADKQRKLEERLSGKKRSRDRDAEEDEPVKLSARDIELRNQVNAYNSEKRAMSLMDMHRKNYVKSKTFQEEDASKRPFDREKDLKGGSSRMDYKRKQEMLKRAGELSSKFGSGRSGSFL